jgi:hypothetical protein
MSCLLSIICNRACNQKGIRDSADDLDTHFGPAHGTSLGGAEFYGVSFAVTLLATKEFGEKRDAEAKHDRVSKGENDERHNER